MVAASGEIGNYGDQKSSVTSGQPVKTNLPSIAYIVIIAIFLVIAVVAVAGVYGCILRKRRLRREARNNHELFAPIIMNNDGGPSKPDALRWADSDTREKRWTTGLTALPKLPGGR